MSDEDSVSSEASFETEGSLLAESNSSGNIEQSNNLNEQPNAATNNTNDELSAYELMQKENIRQAINNNTCQTWGKVITLHLTVIIAYFGLKIRNRFFQTLVSKLALPLY